MIQALRTVMPVKVKMKPKRKVTVRLALEKEEGRALRERFAHRKYKARVRLLDLLLAKPEVSKEEAQKESGLSLKALKELEQKGILKLDSRVSYRNPFEGMERKETRRELNEAQKKIAEAFEADYDNRIFRTYLLHGVTGSGKTEVYLSLIEKVLSSGRQAIVLIPEISLTYQTVGRFYERFGQRIAVLNSRLSKGERSDQITRIENGEADVVIGPRSALFAPVPDLGLIIIDEEHDGAYKSDATPKYHAIPTARYRAGLSGASVVLGSATPLVESYAKTRTGEYVLWELPNRAGGARMPETEVVDLREEFRRGNHSIFSTKLRAEIEDRLAKKEQIILFINRRGFAGFVSCRACGTVLKCPHCDVSLTAHRDRTLRCHYCGFETPFPKACPTCHENAVASFGLGTEKVEAALYREFPFARVLRMDADTTRRKNAHAELLKTFERGEADILLGTQMIVKGHDYPGVTLVGILAADLTLYEQDFRSAEVTFELLCQAAGRAGRGEKSGHVIIQTYTPGHYAVTAAANQSFQDFYKNEMAYRRMMHYPPCAHMLGILVQSAQKADASLAAERIGRMLKKTREAELESIQILGPAPGRIGKLKDIYRYVVYIKGEDESILIDLKGRLEPVLAGHPLFSAVSVQFDFDPVTLA